MLILGHGNIGRALEARLKPFGARVTGVTRSGRDGTTPVAGALAMISIGTYPAGAIEANWQVGSSVPAWHRIYRHGHARCAMQVARE